MIITTTPTVPGKEIAETIGLMRGNAVRAKNVGTDLIAFFRNLVGGEIPEYSKMLAESREQALDRMMEDAAKLGANAVTAVRFSTSHIAAGAAEILVYGTAVRIAGEDVD